MKKLTTLVLLLLSPLVTAQEKEIWTCLSSKINGYETGDEWREQAISPNTYVLTLDGENSILREEFQFPQPGFIDHPFYCEVNAIGIAHCRDSDEKLAFRIVILSLPFLPSDSINRAEGAISSLAGFVGLFGGGGLTQSVFVAPLNCTKL